MALPAAVRKQVEEAAKLEAEMVDEQKKALSSGQTTDETPPTEAASDVVAPTPADDTSPSPEPAAEDWKARHDEIAHKYSVLEGKYKKEVPRLHDELGFLKQKVELLEKITATPQKEDQKATLPDNLTEFAEEYPKIFAAMKSLVTHELMTEMENLPQVKELREKADTAVETSQQFALREFYQDLTSLVPDWDKLNTSPDFLGWLSQRDRYANHTRHELLLDAFNRRDSQTAANIFSDFKDEGNSAPAPASKPAKAGTATLVAPSTPRGAGTPTPSASDKTYTQSQIQKWYRDIALGKLILTPEDKAKQEGEFYRAMQENRVVAG